MQSSNVTEWSTGLVHRGSQITTLFVHVPKTGGTTLEKLGWFERFSDVYPKGGRVAATQCSPYHVPPPMFLADSGCSPQPHRTLAVVRHPYERAVSQFFWQLGVWEKRLGYRSVDMNAFIRDAVTNASRSELRRNPKRSMTMWRMIKGGPFHMDCHFLPQARYVWHQQHKVASYVCHGAWDIRTDALAFARGTTLDNRAGGEIRPLRDFESACRNTSSAKRLVPCRWLELSKDTVRALNRLYKADFSSFGFQQATPDVRTLSVHVTNYSYSLALPGGSAPRGCVYPL